MRRRNQRINHILRTCLFGINEHDDIVIIRRQTTKKKKKKVDFFALVVQYGVEVPRNVKHALQLDAENGNTLWQDAMAKEIKALDDLECFEYRPAENAPGADFQKTNLHMIFAVKHDGRRKARLVAGGHLIEIANNICVYSSTVKTMLVWLLDVIADAKDLKQLCGDVGNAFVNAYTNELVYCWAGPEFGDRQGSIIVIKKALYGLQSSAKRFHAHFADCLCSVGFFPSCYDPDVWLCQAEHGYYFICTHVNDFKILARDPHMYMRHIQARYTIKDPAPPSYYLGMSYARN